MSHRNPFDLTIGRRGFLKAAGLGAGAMLLHGGLLSRSAKAQTGADHRFVFAYFGGGWDTLLCLDPRDPGVFTEERIRDTNIQLGWDRIPADFGRDMISYSDSPITFGPAIGDFRRHYQKACVVRGISMDTLTHEVGRRYMLTGQMPAGLQATGSSIATRIIAQQGDNAPIPNLVSRAETYNKGLPSFASGLSVNGAGDLVLTLQRLPGAPPQSVFDQLNAYRARRTNCDPAALNHNGFFDQLRSAEIKGSELINQGLDRHFNFGLPENRDLAERFGIVQRGALASGGSAGEQAAVAAWP